MTDPRIDDLLAFCIDQTPVEAWFARDGRFDEEIRLRFAALSETAAAGTLDDWRDGPRGCVALCILLDQVPRNIHRGTPRAFATDAAGAGAGLR